VINVKNRERRAADSTSPLLFDEHLIDPPHGEVMPAGLAPAPVLSCSSQDGVMVAGEVSRSIGGPARLTLPSSPATAICSGAISRVKRLADTTFRTSAGSVRMVQVFTSGRHGKNIPWLL
jgi:hypothetical protein